MGEPMFQEGEHAAGMVRVPVGEDDALDDAHVGLHRFDISNERKSVRPCIKKDCTGFLSIQLSLLLDESG